MDILVAHVKKEREGKQESINFAFLSLLLISTLNFCYLMASSLFLFSFFLFPFFFPSSYSFLFPSCFPFTYRLKDITTQGGPFRGRIPNLFSHFFPFESCPKRWSKSKRQREQRSKGDSRLLPPLYMKSLYMKMKMPRCSQTFFPLTGNSKHAFIRSLEHSRLPFNRLQSVFA